MSVKGYKVFKHDWTCRGKQYTCPGFFEEDVNPAVCEAGMHFCEAAADCFKYYDFSEENRVAEVIAHGDVSKKEDKCATNKLEIVREIPWEELLKIVNTGKGCTGRCNTGDRNTGDRNTGDRNTGNCNTGNCNTGNCNTGNWNTGNCNTGDRNTGDRNTGDRNTGNWNTGDRNTGNWNTGDRNTGDWNNTSFSNGCFNTEQPKIYLFNKPSDWTLQDWFESRARKLLNQIDNCPLEYIYFDDMTGEEKAAHPEAKTTGGYLKKRTTADSARKWWASLDDDERNVIYSLPNFDPAIFEEITGIDVTEKA